MPCLLHQKYSDQNVTFVYQPGVNSRIVVVLACPGENEKALGFPASGETGTRLCRIIEKMRQIDKDKYGAICLRNVCVVNASANVHDSSSQIRKDDITLNACLKSALLKTSGFPRRLILLFGQHAIWAYKFLACKYQIEGDSVVRFCHIGQRATKGIEGLDKNQMIDHIAEFFVKCDKSPGEYGWNEFRDVVKGARWENAPRWLFKNSQSLGLWNLKSGAQN